ncbi:aspartate aminotransferase family protein, partial [Escherichia coli]
MSDSNPILFSSAQSIEAYQPAIEQSTQAVMQWLKQPEMYQGKTVAELRDRIKLDFNPKGLGNEAAIERAVEFF